MSLSFRPAAGILGLGTALPPTVRTNDFWSGPLAPRARPGDLLDLGGGVPGEVARQIAALRADPFGGARLRHVLRDGELTSDLEVEAGRRAMADAGLEAADIDTLITFSLTRDMILPSNAPAVQAKLDLPHVFGMCLDVVCASSVTAASVAAAQVMAGFSRNVLCVFSSGASRTVDPAHPNAPAFGDGASAFVIGPVPEGFGVLGRYGRTEGRFRDAVVDAPYVDGQPQREWHRAAGPIRVGTFDLELARESGRAQMAFCREACEGALAQAGLTLADVDFFFGHQTTGWLNAALAESLGIGPDKTLHTFDEVANLGSANMPFNLHRAVKSGRVRHGDVVLAYAPGAGITATSVVLRWHSP